MTSPTINPKNTPLWDHLHSIYTLTAWTCSYKYPPEYLGLTYKSMPLPTHDPLHKKH